MIPENITSMAKPSKFWIYYDKKSLGIENSEEKEKN